MDRTPTFTLSSGTANVSSIIYPFTVGGTTFTITRIESDVDGDLNIQFTPSFTDANWNKLNDYKFQLGEEKYFFENGTLGDAPSVIQQIRERYNGSEKGHNSQRDNTTSRCSHQQAVDYYQREREQTSI